MVQESTNSFDGGLIKDLHPLTVPNNVLTDALNATLLTFNGNELILQNDMGNTKIEGAKLPDGYTPIGMKEHGGILYIVSSNGESVEIGSFPSPGYSEEDITNKDFLLAPYKIFETGVANQIGKNIKLSDKVLRSGDKFLISFNVSAGLSSISTITERKIYKPKIISIANGVELDITDTLIRQKRVNGTDYDYWFIPEILSTEDLNTLRRNKYTQTYKSRKSGDLYFRIDLETIDAFKLFNGNGTSSYPILTKEGTNFKLKFSFNIEHESLIKCDEIKLEYSLDGGVTQVLYIEEGKTLSDFVNGSNPNQYDNVFDLNIGTSRNKRIDYKITPLNDEYNLSFDKFIITDSLDLSKNNLSWTLSPVWLVDIEYKTCEPDPVNPEFSTGYALHDVVARFGTLESGEFVMLGADDLPISGVTKQAAYVRLGQESVYEDDFDILGTFTLDSNYSPTFTPSIVFNDTTAFRFESSACLAGYEMDITYEKSVTDSTFGGTIPWPNWMTGPKEPTQEMIVASKENQNLNYDIEITTQVPAIGDFGDIIFKINYTIESTIWGWTGSTWQNTFMTDTSPSELTFILNKDDKYYGGTLINHEVYETTPGDENVITLNKFGNLTTYSMEWDESKFLANNPTVNGHTPNPPLLLE